MTLVTATTKSKTRTRALGRASGATPISTRRWFTSGAIAMPTSLFLHEMAHYTTALLVGASDVTFEWIAVEATIEPGTTARGLIGVAGPTATGILIVTAWWFSQLRFRPVVWALGLVAGFRSLVALPYAVRTVLRNADDGNFVFDEFDAAVDFGIAPMWLVLPSLTAFAFGAWFFGGCIRRHDRSLSILTVLVGSTIGLLLYATLGPATS